MTPPPPPTATELLQHTGALRALAQQLVRDDASADDVVQETLVAALTHPPRHRVNLGGWLRTVARNVALRSHRGETRRRRREHAVARPEARSSAEDSVAVLETHGAVVDAVLALPEPYRSTIVQRYFKGWSAARIARSEGVSRQAVSKRLAGALARVRRTLDQRHGGDRSVWLAALVSAGGLRDAAASGAASALATGGTIMGTKTAVGAAALSIGFFALGFTARPFLSPLEEANEQRVVALEDASKEPVLDGRASPVAATPQKTPAQAQKKPDWDRSDPKAWLERINKHEVTQRAVPYFVSLKNMPPEKARPLLAWIFPRMNHEEKRVECLRTFSRVPRGELMVYVLQLALADPTARVRKDAYYWAERLGYEPFAEEPDRLDEWVKENDGKPITQVIEDSARAFSKRVKSLSGRDLRRLLEYADDGSIPPRRHSRVDVAALLRADGMLEYLMSAMPHGTSDEEENLQEEILEWVQALKPSAAFIEEHFFAILREPARYPESLAGRAYAIVGDAGTKEAVDALIASYETAVNRIHWWTISTALTKAKATRAIPTMIGMIEADNGYNSIYGIGYFGLGKFTGVKYHKSHDGAWWRAWWEENSHRFANEVPDPEIPRMAPVAKGGPK